MSGARVLLIEKRRRNAISFGVSLEKKGFQLAIEHNVSDAVQRASEFAPDMTILDAASMRTTGSRMCRSLRKSIVDSHIILVVPEGSSATSDCGADLVLGHPFTPRKLLNAVRRLLPNSDGEWLIAGPVELNVSQLKVRRRGREVRLTPKSAQLLRILMSRARKVVTRKELIKRVWDTDYLGDTRTLDVHISWLRHAIEKNPRQPRLVKTVRRQGYYLEVPPIEGS